jgi:hypothetical protein
MIGCATNETQTIASRVFSLPSASAAVYQKKNTVHVGNVYMFWIYHVTHVYVNDLRDCFHQYLLYVPLSMKNVCPIFSTKMSRQTELRN